MRRRTCKGLTLTLSLSKGERRPKAATGEDGSSHVFNSLLGYHGRSDERSPPRHSVSFSTIQSSIRTAASAWPLAFQ